MNFKDMVKKDIFTTFLNPEEFGDVHTIDGKQMTIIIDEPEALERQKRFNQHMDGMYIKQKLIYVSEKEFGPLPMVGAVILLDGKPFKITDAVSEGGVHSITLEANKVNVR